MVTGFETSWYLNTGMVVTRCFISCTAASCFGSQCHIASLSNSLFNSSQTSDRCGMNLARSFIKPMKRWTAFMSTGCDISKMVLTFSGKAFQQFEDSMCPWRQTFVTFNCSFFRPSLSLTCLQRSISTSNFASWSRSVICVTSSTMTMAFAIGSTPWNPANTSCCLCLYSSGARERDTKRQCAPPFPAPGGPECYHANAVLI